MTALDDAKWPWVSEFWGGMSRILLPLWIGLAVTGMLMLAASVIWDV
jgi:hypothetical protein